MSRILSTLNDEKLDFTVILPYGGKSARFDFLDIVLFEGNEYIVAAPKKEEFVEIFRIDNVDTDNESYVLVDDERILNEVFEIFQLKNEDEYDF